MSDLINKIHFSDWRDIVGEIPAGFFDLLLLDPPFDMTKQDWDKKIDLQEMWMHSKRVIKSNGVILVKAKAPFDKVVAASNLSMFKYEWIWEKNKATGHLNASFMPMQAHENILVFYNNRPDFNPQKTAGHKPMNFAKSNRESNVYGKAGESTNNAGSTERNPRTVLYFPVVNNDDPERIHPNQTPVELWRYFIRTYTNSGAKVGSWYGGSCSVSEACILENRDFIECEFTEKHYKDAEKRINKLLI